jgi:long-chain acyl-CoA synthetase
MSNPAPTLPALLLSRAIERGPLTILRKKERGIWQAITWAALGLRVQTLGLALRAAGIGPGGAAAILAETSPDWLAADLAIQGAGGMSLALDPAGEAEPIGALLGEAGCRLVFVENEEQLDKVLGIRDRCPSLSRIVIMDMKGLREFADPMCASLDDFVAGPGGSAADWAALVAALDPAAVAMLAPQGAGLAALSHAALAATLARMEGQAGLTAADERLAFLSPSQASERVLGLYLALHCGSICNFVESVGTVAEDLQEVRPHALFAPAEVWERLQGSIAAAVGGATWLQRMCCRAALATAGRGTFGALAERLVLRRLRRAMGLDRLRLARVDGDLPPAAVTGWYRSIGIELRPLDAVVPVAWSGGAMT